MSTSNQEIASLIVDFFTTVIEKKELSEDSNDSLEVAIDCITDSFGIERDNVKETIASKFGGKSLQQLVTTSTSTEESKESSEDVTVNIPKEDAEVKAKAEALKLEGNKAIAEKNYDLAVEKYTEAINVLPTNVVYYANRAAAYTNLQKYDEAIRDAEAAIKIDPTYSKGYSRLAYAKYVQDKPVEALEAYKKVLDIEGDNATPIMKRGYETAKKRVEETLNQNKNEDSTDVEKVSQDKEEPSAGSGAAPDFSSMFGGAGAGAGGMPDLSSMLGGGLGGGLGSLLNNPQMMQAAQSMMQDPNTMQKMQSMMQNPAIQQMAQNFASGNTNFNDIMNDPSIRDMASNMFGGAGSSNNSDDSEKK